MSLELDYFPPSKTRWQWHPKTLNYSPWKCDFSKQRDAIGVGSERWQQDQPSFYRYREDAFKDAVSRLRSALKEGL